MYNDDHWPHSQDGSYRCCGMTEDDLAAEQERMAQEEREEELRAASRPACADRLYNGLTCGQPATGRRYLGDIEGEATVLVCARHLALTQSAGWPTLPLEPSYAEAIGWVGGTVTTVSLEEQRIRGELVRRIAAHLGAGHGVPSCGHRPECPDCIEVRALLARLEPLTCAHERTERHPDGWYWCEDCAGGEAEWGAFVAAELERALELEQGPTVTVAR